MASTVHHDVLLAALYSLGLWWAVRAIRLSPILRDIAYGGVLAGLAMLTKLSGVTLLPVMVMAVFLRGWLTRDWRATLRSGLSIVGVALAVSGWWYIRNQYLYGDPLGWRMFLMIHSHMVRTTRYTLGIFRQEFLGQLLCTFWGGFGYMHITFLESSRYLWFLTVFAIVGLLVACVRWVVKGRPFCRSQLGAWAIACTGLLLIVIAFVRFSVSTLGAGHGRYLFPAAATMGGLLIVELNGFADWRGEKAISIILGLVMLGYGIWAPLAFAVPKYVGPEQITLDELEQSTATHCDWVFDNTVNLAAYSIEPNLAMPDTWLSLRLYWQGVGPSASRPDAYVRANLIDDAGQTLYSASFWPANSSKTTQQRHQYRLV